MTTRSISWGRPRLRTVLMLVNLVVLVLPLAGIQVLRLYESALVRQTESALIAQAAFVAAFYRALVLEISPQAWSLESRPLSITPSPSDQANPTPWRPRPPELDLASSPRLPPFPDGMATAAPNPLAQAVGLRLQPVLRDAQLTTLAGIRVVDPWGVIVASTGTDVGSAVPTGTELDLALTGQYASVLRNRAEPADPVDPSALDSISRTNNIRVFIAAPIVLQDKIVGAVLLSRTPPNIVQALYAKRMLLLQGMVGLLILVVLMSIVTSRLVARPITRLAQGAEAVAAGRAAQLAVQKSPRTHEMAQLQSSVAAMAATLEQRADYLEEFARHVSHEFKTPITSIQGAVEVLRDHAQAMSAEQQDRFLSNIDADADRLRRLTTRLLDLTRADMATAALTEVDAGQLLRDLAHKHQDANRTEDQRISAIVGDDPIPVATNASFVEAVLDTLIENALQHQANEVRLRLISDTHQVVFEVSDNGSGISASNRAKIFEPFFTTNRESGGTGLGLTIAAKLAESLNGHLHLVPLDTTNATDTRFQLSLPK